MAAKLEGPHKELAERALLRNPPKNLPKHEDAAAWLKLAEGEGNPQAGERIFYHLRVGGCFRCHEFEGRGYTVGPDLSTIGRSLTRERLVQSLVDPSREIAPQFTNWAIQTTDGEVLTGIHVGDEVDGRMKFADQNGRVFHVHPDKIDQRKPSNQSIMPEGLVDNLTAQELRDLVAFLLRSKSPDPPSQALPGTELPRGSASQRAREAGASGKCVPRRSLGTRNATEGDPYSATPQSPATQPQTPARRSAGSGRRGCRGLCRPARKESSASTCRRPS